MQIVHGEASPCYSTITKWHCELKMFGVTKDLRGNSGRKSEATDDCSAERLREMLDERRDQEVREQAKRTVKKKTILIEVLDMKKVSSPKILEAPKILDSRENQQRVHEAQKFLDRFESH